MEGVVRLLEDLQLSPDSKLVLLMAWKFQAAAQCEFSREEFLNGMSELGYVMLDFKKSFPSKEIHISLAIFNLFLKLIKFAAVIVLTNYATNCHPLRRRFKKIQNLKNSINSPLIMPKILDKKDSIWRWQLHTGTLS